MIKTPSPNFNERVGTEPIKYVVLHYTGMKTAQDALNRLCDPAAQVSAHYMIDEDGSLYQLVDEQHRAWHAGQSFWRGQTDLNSLSIGIELVNPGHEFGYRPFLSAQIDALKNLLSGIFKRYSLPASALLAHSDIAPMRKQDPGELFPWPQLAKEGFGLWPVGPAPLDQTKSIDADNMLRTMGYDCPEGDTAKCEAAQRAFLRRYHPEQLRFGFNDETLFRLKALYQAMA